MKADIADRHRGFEEMVKLVYAPKLTKKLSSIAVALSIGAANAFQNHPLRVGVGFDVLAKPLHGGRPRRARFTIRALGARWEGGGADRAFVPHKGFE